MIQTALIFILGFLAAGFLAVLVAPAIWRRAVLLTRRRLEAALPLSMGEISADKDAVRAEYAVTVRRLEMTIKLLREEAIEHSLASGRAEGEAREAARAFAEMDAARAQMAAEHAAELEALGALYDEASFTASNRQIELVAQEANIERLRQEISAMKETRRQAETQLRDATLQLSAQERALDEEKRRATTLEHKNSELVTALSDVQEKLERREREFTRGRSQNPDDVDDEAATALLREQIKDLAAEMVSMTAQIEGASSEIHQVLAGTSEKDAAVNADGQSLAERIRALQKQLERANQGDA